MPRWNKTLEQRFFEKIELITESGCWVWMGAMFSDGYGQMKINRRKELAHRISWRLHSSQIANGLDVLHRCDIPCCVNPDHLFLGTDSDNQRDSYRKGRGRWKTNMN